MQGAWCRMEDTGNKRLTCERTDVLRGASLFLSLSSVAFAFQIRIVAIGAQYSAPTEAQVMADIFVRASKIHVKRSHLQTFRLLRYPTTVWAPKTQFCGSSLTPFPAILDH